MLATKLRLPINVQVNGRMYMVIDVQFPKGGPPLTVARTRIILGKMVKLNNNRKSKKGVNVRWIKELFSRESILRLEKL